MSHAVPPISKCGKTVHTEPNWLSQFIIVESALQQSSSKGKALYIALHLRYMAKYGNLKLKTTVCGASLAVAKYFNFSYYLSRFRGAYDFK